MIESSQKERMLLGAVLCNNSLVKLLHGMSEDDFATPLNKQVFNEMRRLAQEKKPIDPTMLTENVPGIDGASLVNYIVGIAKEGNEWNAEQYAKDLHDLGNKRKLYKLFKSCAERLVDEDAQVVIDDCRAKLRDLGAIRGKVTYMPEVASRMLDRMEAISAGTLECVKTGLADLDRIIGGMYGGDLVVVGARPAVGKSTFGMALALSAARQGKRALVCSCEMSDVQYAQRIASEITGINSMRLRTANLNDQQWTQIGDALNEMSTLGVGFTFSSNYVEDLYSVCVAEKDGKGLDILIVDYIQIMETRERCDNETVRIARISGRLKRLALELGIPVVALAQVKRQEGSAMRMPTLQELKGSGSLEQDADKVLFLHRVESSSDPYCVSGEAFNRWLQMGDQMIVVNVAKHRDGGVGCFPVRFMPGHMKYMCMTHREGSNESVS